MTIEKYKKFYVSPYNMLAKELNMVQDSIEQVLTPLTNAQIIDGNYLKEIDLTASVDNLIEHKLGREPLGWLIVRKFAAVDIYESLTDSSGNSYDRKKFINFQVGTNMTNVYFWIF